MRQWYEDPNLWLFTMSEYQQLPDGTVLEGVNGKKAVKGVDHIGHNQRFGLIAWGVRDPWNHDLKDLFLIFKLKQ